MFCVLQQKKDRLTLVVAQIPGVPYVFVHENHPVINLLRINKHVVGVDVDKQPKMDGQWHKITQSLFDSSCDTIKTRILARIRTHDLNDLNVSCPVYAIVVTLCSIVFFRL